MTIDEFMDVLVEMDIPYAYSHFDNDNTISPVNPPFLTWLAVGEDGLMADNILYHKVIDIDLELYTVNKDIALENRVEETLTKHSIPYTASQRWIESEKVFQKLYELRLM